MIHYKTEALLVPLVMSVITSKFGYHTFPVFLFYCYSIFEFESKHYMEARAHKV